MVKKAEVSPAKKSYFELILGQIRRANTRGKGITLPELKKRVEEENGSLHLPTFKRTLSAAIQNGMVELGATKSRFLATASGKDEVDSKAAAAKAKSKAAAKKKSAPKKSAKKGKKSGKKTSKKATKKSGKKKTSKPKKAIKKRAGKKAGKRGRPKKAAKGKRGRARK